MYALYILQALTLGVIHLGVSNFKRLDPGECPSYDVFKRFKTSTLGGEGPTLIRGAGGCLWGMPTFEILHLEEKSATLTKFDLVECFQGPLKTTQKCVR